jgi:hypothetical protein
MDGWQKFFLDIDYHECALLRIQGTPGYLGKRKRVCRKQGHEENCNAGEVQEVNRNARAVSVFSQFTALLKDLTCAPEPS